MGLQNRPLAATTPTTNQVLTWTGAQWAPQTVATGVTSVFGRSGAITGLAGDYSAAQVTNAVDMTKPTSYSAGTRQGFAGNATSAGLQVAPSVLLSTAQTGDIVVDTNSSNQLKIYTGTSWLTLTPAPANANYATPLDKYSAGALRQTSGSPPPGPAELAELGWPHS